MIAKPKAEEFYSEEETERRRDALVRVMTSMPPQPKGLPKKKKRKAFKKASASSSDKGRGAHGS